MVSIIEWNTLLYSSAPYYSKTDQTIAVIFFIVCIFILNQIFQNIFFAILLDGFDAKNLQVQDKLILDKNFYKKNEEEKEDADFLENIGNTINPLTYVNKFYDEVIKIDNYIGEKDDPNLCKESLYLFN